ncbi:MAG: capsule biosynthesis protein [Rhodobacteraceae bacterium]|nr:capsule biosynthesis protein [Paracoccaceae bacterium]
MITKPKAKKFRIRRSPLSVFGASDAHEAEAPVVLPPSVPRRDMNEPLFETLDDGFGPGKFATAAQGEITTAGEAAAEGEIDAIRGEGLTGRQLRTARRVAQRNGLPATSDFDAVRLLRRAGIDPFQRANMLELVVSDTQDKLPATTDDRDRLPQTVKPIAPPSTEIRAEDNRVRDIMRIQQDLARRRRRRMALLYARLAFFVLLPTALAGYYYYKIATPFYAVKAAFVINKSEGGASASPVASFLTGTQFASSQDSINAQAFLDSRDAMVRLDSEHGFKKLFSDPSIDPLQRLAPNATNEAAYRLYQRNVVVGYDPSEGIINLEVATPYPQKSVEFAKALIGYAEEQVDKMTLRMRDDQMKGAHDSYDDAEKKLEAANTKVVQLQQKYSVMSSDAEVSLVTSQIATLSAELDRDNLDLQQMMSAQTPTQARIDPLKQRISLITQQIADLRQKLTVNNGDGESLAAIQSQILAAQAEVQTRQLMLAQSLQALESARVTANEQTRYFSVGVQPVAPDEPTYPRAFENTIVAFLIFAGLYLMLSMTASILREQVSA